MGCYFIKILYGINTIGQGHINRSRTVINQLIKDGHEVHCLFSGPKPPSYALKLVDHWFRTYGYRMKINGSTADPAMTFLNNFIKSKSIAKSLLKSFRIGFNNDYDAIMSDFELSSCLTGFFLRKPVIVVDHQHSLIHPGALRAPGKFSDIFNVIIAIGMSVPYFNHIFSLDLVNQPIRRSKETLFPLIWKNELKNYPISVKDHYCVYLPYISKAKLCKCFRTFPENKFFVYGFNVNETYDNVIFKKTSRSGFLEDMASSKGVLSHTGFSITWEVMLFNKPFYSIPLDHHYEQQANAYRLKNLNLAFIRDDLTILDLREFIEITHSSDFQNQGKLNIVQPSVLTKFIYKEIATA